MTLTMTLTQADLIAALQAWVASPQGGSAQAAHQMNATVAPTVDGSGGGVTVQLNF